MATSAAVTTFWRTLSNPEQAQAASGQMNRANWYRLLWAFYANEAYSGVAAWQTYRSQHALYRQTRQIYSPVRRLCDAYAGLIYPGVLSEDGSQLPDGIPLAIPLADDTDPELKSAIAQWWQWAGWQAEKSVLVRFGAITGNVLVEAVDDVDRGKITASVRWPGFVSDLELDAAGNVKMYELCYSVPDGNGSTYEYSKRVDGAVFATFKDGKPFAYSEILGARWENPYGFVPAVWIRHNHVGGDFGAPAIDGSLGKIDELNSLASHVHDQVHKKINAPALLPGVTSLTILTGQQKRGSTDEMSGSAALGDREEMLLIGGPQGSDVKSLAGTLELADAIPYIEKLIGEIEQDHPELTLYRELRAMSQVTGPGAQRLLGDAAARVYEAAANYDAGSKSLFGMAVAMGGWRAQQGDWGPTNGLTRQQAKFLPFNLDSFASGDLDFTILPRPLVSPTQAERWADQTSKYAAIKTATEAGIPLAVAQADVEGIPYDSPEFDAMNKAQTEAIQRAQTLALEDVPGGQQ